MTFVAKLVFLIPALNTYKNFSEKLYFSTVVPDVFWIGKIWDAVLCRRETANLDCSAQWIISSTVSGGRKTLHLE